MRFHNQSARVLSQLFRATDVLPLIAAIKTFYYKGCKGQLPRLQNRLEYKKTSVTNEEEAKQINERQDGAPKKVTPYGDC
ncbi:MAG: hypothetical protein ABIR13_00660 [Polaromonas sp.]